MSVSILRSIGGLTFDAVIEEQHYLELEVTDHPVETGVSISDHARMRPKEVTIVAGVGNAKLHDKPDPYGFGDGRAAEAFVLLSRLQELAEPFDVQTGLVLYENMVCTNLRALQDKDSDQALVFSADLREVRIVSTQTVTLTTSLTGKQAKPAAGTTTSQAGSETQRGQVQAKPASGAAAEGPRKSAAASIYDAYKK